MLSTKIQYNILRHNLYAACFRDHYLSDDMAALKLFHVITQMVFIISGPRTGRFDGDAKAPPLGQPILFLVGLLNLW